MQNERAHGAAENGAAESAADDTVENDAGAGTVGRGVDTAAGTAANEGFLAPLADRLAALPAVEAVTLGGSRALGTAGPDSDWDLAVYYRGAFDPEDLRSLAREQEWPGEVSEIGGWGGGVFNGGAWLTVEGCKVDVHYRDLDVVEHQLAEAREGRFHHEPLMFHLAGIPSYLVVGELAVNRVLRGRLPRPEYPSALRRTAYERWSATARLTLLYSEANHAPKGLRPEAAGAIATAAMQAAHAVTAAHGRWVTNEKTLLANAGLGRIDTALAHLFAQGTAPESLPESVAASLTETRTLIESSFTEAEKVLPLEEGCLGDG
ncbi:nucleotidyltransferase domain-containing protein [Nocardiopsis baichengensis]|uniref:nucleotidyltransferase domain-containing protein n=1 Tax=Nocardiopsis baichengensis TaxID=280240 RepID=UPI000347635D|nr:nucleotidyltransferase domain-containing protein [Nocardiopsis baichengensis]